MWVSGPALHGGHTNNGLFWGVNGPTLVSLEVFPFVLFMEPEPQEGRYFILDLYHVSLKGTTVLLSCQIS